VSGDERPALSADPPFSLLGKWVLLSLGCLPGSVASGGRYRTGVGFACRAARKVEAGRGGTRAEREVKRVERANLAASRAAETARGGRFCHACSGELLHQLVGGCGEPCVAQFAVVSSRQLQERAPAAAWRRDSNRGARQRSSSVRRLVWTVAPSKTATLAKPKSS